jgi:hypothetical protein
MRARVGSPRRRYYAVPPEARASRRARFRLGHRARVRAAGRGDVGARPGKVAALRARRLDRQGWPSRGAPPGDPQDARWESPARNAMLRRALRRPSLHVLRAGPSRAEAVQPGTRPAGGRGRRALGGLAGGVARYAAGRFAWTVRLGVGPVGQASCSSRAGRGRPGIDRAPGALREEMDPFSRARRTGGRARANMCPNGAPARSRPRGRLPAKPPLARALVCLCPTLRRRGAARRRGAGARGTPTWTPGRPP